MLLKRLPIPVLRAFVALVWASDSPMAATYERPTREHMLPSGMMHLVFRLTDCPLHIFDPHDDLHGQSVGSALVGGVRSRYYVRESSAPSCSVGAVLRPGAGPLLFGVTADQLAERHTALEDLWGSSARSVRERLLEVENAEHRLVVLESELAARLPRVRSLHPAIASVIDVMPTLHSVEAAVRHSGISHRQFIAQFRRAVGLAPKTYLGFCGFSAHCSPSERASPSPWRRWLRRQATAIRRTSIAIFWRSPVSHP